MSATYKRRSVIDKYALIIGRNIYSQTLRDYCYKPYKDGKYYSDCSSSISYAYKEAGLGFGILNTAGMYQSNKFTTIDADIADGIPDMSRLRPGDMLLFAGTDASRPLKIGHVEMYCGNGIICGHGSGTPSYKDLVVYCKSRYASFAPGGWRKGLVCVRRYIQDDAQPVPEPIKLSGWKEEDGGWRYYNGDTGLPVCNDWVQEQGKWYWFNGAGIMITNTWYRYNEGWYYLGPDGAMCQSQLVENNGKIYAVDADGKMVTGKIMVSALSDGALEYKGLA